MNDTTTRELLGDVLEWFGVTPVTPEMAQEKREAELRIQAHLASLDAEQPAPADGLPSELPRWIYARDTGHSYEYQFANALERHIRIVLYPALIAKAGEVEKAEAALHGHQKHHKAMAEQVALAQSENRALRADLTTAEGLLREANRIFQYQWEQAASRGEPLPKNEVRTVWLNRCDAFLFRPSQAQEQQECDGSGWHRCRRHKEAGTGPGALACNCTECPGCRKCPANESGKKVEG